MLVNNNYLGYYLSLICTSFKILVRDIYWLVLIINGLVKAVLVYMQDRGFSSFASNVMKLSVNETKWSSLLARNHALILYIFI